MERQRLGLPIEIVVVVLIAKLVMPGLVSGIHVLWRPQQKDVDGRGKPGHDEKKNHFQVGRKRLKKLAAL